MCPSSTPGSIHVQEISPVTLLSITLNLEKGCVSHRKAKNEGSPGEPTRSCALSPPPVEMSVTAMPRTPPARPDYTEREPWKSSGQLYMALLAANSRAPSGGGCAEEKVSNCAAVCLPVSGLCKRNQCTCLLKM